MRQPKQQSSGFELEINKSASPLVWTTKKVSQLLEAIEEGYKPKSTPFFEGRPELRAGKISFEYTEFEYNELKKCSRDIVHFANTYCVVMTPKGIAPIKLRGYQEELLRQMVRENFNVVLAARQAGKTITASIFIAWYVIFNADKNALLLSNKGATTREIIDKGKTILEHLPFFIKPGIIKYGEMGAKFDNGCRIIGQTTTKKSAIGFTINLLFMDEFAHIPDNIVHSFYENVYPTVSADPNSKIVITSTPNGFNKFHEIYTQAKKGLNEYVPFTINWWDVPGRDDEWMRKEIANLGSDEAFNRQYGNDFITSSGLLLSPDTLRFLEENKKKFIFHDIPELDDIQIDYRDLVWHPSFNLDEIEEDYNYWLITIDIAEGNGGDYSVINIFQITMMDRKHFKKILNPGSFTDYIGLKQVGKFHSNRHKIEDFSKIVYVLCYELLYTENIKIIIEWNTYGSELMRRLETVFPKRNNFDEETIVKFKHRIDANTRSFGLKLKTDNKVVFCQNFARCVAQRRIIFEDTDTIEESRIFGKTPNGKSYSGNGQNDDLIMSCINASEFFMTTDFSEFAEEYYDTVDIEIQNEIEEILDKDTSGGDLNFDIYDLV